MTDHSDPDPQARALDIFLKLEDLPVKILAVLCHSDAPLTQTQIEGLTGRSPNTVTKAMAALKFHKLAVQGRDRGPWAPTVLARSLFEKDSSTVEGEKNLGRGAPRGSADITATKWDENILPPPTSRTYLNTRSRFAVPSTVEGRNGHNPQNLRNENGDSSTVEGSTDDSSTVEETNLGSIPQKLRNEHGPSSPDTDGLRVDLRRRQRLVACRQSNINPPALTRIVQNDDIDPIHIFGHVWQTEKQGHRLGAAIWRIEHFQTLSKEAARAAEMQMTIYDVIPCKECHRRFNVTYSIGETITDYRYTCPHCGAENEPDDTDHTQVIDPERKDTDHASQ